MEVKPGYKKTEIGLIPENWEVSKTGELFDFKNGLNKSKENFGHGTPIVNYMDVFKKPFLLKKDIGGRVLVNSKEKLAYSVQKGDVFFTRTSETAEEIGITSVMLEETENTVYSGFVLRARPISEKLIDNFKAYCFSANYYRKQVVSKASYTTRALTSGKALSKTIVAIPPKNEQNLIAEALGDMDALLESLNSLIAKKRAIKQATMQQLLSGETRVSTPQNDWTDTTLGEIVERFVGGGTPSRTVADYWGGNIPWVSTKDFASFSPYTSQESITRQGLNNSAASLIPAETLLISTRMAVGRTAIYKVDVAINQDIKALIPRAHISQRFLLHWLNHNNHKISSTSNGSTVSGISINDLKRIKIKIPDIHEQNSIAKILDDMDYDISILESRIHKTNSLKQAMMQELLTGRTRLI